jgi:protein-L-isoaspartate(D-aspartate) O-methyltransferase
MCSAFPERAAQSRISALERMMADAALQRRNMVESQVRPSDVTDRRVTAAMTRIPRETFLPARLANLAYSDEDLTVAPGRVMLSPSTLARLVQLAEIGPGDKALVVGGCCGYAAAIVAQLAASVVALLPDDASAAEASKACAALGVENVTAVSGDMAAGWAAAMPYDVVLIEGGVETVPVVLTTQLADSARLVAVEVERGLGHAFLLHKQGQLFARREAFQTAAPLVPGFEASKPAFVF